MVRGTLYETVYRGYLENPVAYMKVWIVQQNIDYDMTEVSAVYDAEALAEQHAKELGGWVVDATVQDTAHSDIHDPVKQEKRRQEQEKWRQESQKRREDDEALAKQRAEVRPHDRMGLCHCVTFNDGDRRFINDHGYCTFCGGFEFAVFRKEKGEEALQKEIDKLDLYRREKMRLIVSAPKLDISDA